MRSNRRKTAAIKIAAIVRSTHIHKSRVCPYTFQPQERNCALPLYCYNSPDRREATDDRHSGSPCGRRTVRSRYGGRSRRPRRPRRTPRRPTSPPSRPCPSTAAAGSGCPTARRAITTPCRRPRRRPRVCRCCSPTRPPHRRNASRTVSRTKTASPPTSRKSCPQSHPRLGSRQKHPHPTPSPVRATAAAESRRAARRADWTGAGAGRGIGASAGSTLRGTRPRASHSSRASPHTSGRPVLGRGRPPPPAVRPSRPRPRRRQPNRLTPPASTPDSSPYPFQ